MRNVKLMPLLVVRVPPPTCARLRSGLRRLRAAPPQLQLLGARRRSPVALAGPGHADAGQHPQRLRDEALQTLVGLLPAQRHLRRHDALPLDDEDALLAGAVLEAAVALVALEPRQHAVVAAPRALGGPLERGPRLGHRRPHVQVGRPVAVHPVVFPRDAQVHVRNGGGEAESGELLSEGRGCTALLRHTHGRMERRRRRRSVGLLWRIHLFSPAPRD